MTLQNKNKLIIDEEVICPICAEDFIVAIKDDSPLNDEVVCSYCKVLLSVVLDKNKKWELIPYEK